MQNWQLPLSNIFSTISIFFFPLGPNIFSFFNYKLAVNFFPFTPAPTKTSTPSLCGAIESPAVTEMKYWNGC